jgi:hypothetical protein
MGGCLRVAPAPVYLIGLWASMRRYSSLETGGMNLDKRREAGLERHESRC